MFLNFKPIFSTLRLENIWQWIDGTSLALPSEDGWHPWYPGEPDDGNEAQDCLIVTNYR